MALAFLDDEDVQVEAALAAVKIAAAIAPNNQSKARAAAKKVLSMTNSETVRKQAEELIAEVDRLRNI